MIRIKFLDSHYDKYSGVSIVRVATRYGVYEGIAREHPEEKYHSKFFGCMIAECRANIKALKDALKFKKAELKGAERVYAECQTKQTHGVVKGIKKEIIELEALINIEKVEIKQIEHTKQKAIDQMEEKEQKQKTIKAVNVLAPDKRNSII